MRASKVLLSAGVWLALNYSSGDAEEAQSEDDFALYDGLEALFYKFARKMELSCVVDGELHANAQPAGSSDEGKRLAKRKKTSDLVFQRNSDLSGAVEPWAPGTLAVVAGCVEIKILRRVHAIDATPAR